MWQDIIHLAAICGLLYFAPQIQERLQASHGRPVAGVAGDDTNVVEDRDDESQQGEMGADAPRNDAVAEPGLAELPDRNHLDDDDADDNANEHIEEGQPGPARAPVIPEQRNVGAKKAKALARRDQRRAYHEFQRSQGEAQRAREAEGAEERERAQAAERERRRAAEAALEAKKAKEREERRAREEAERVEEQRRREQAVALVRSRLQEDRMCDLFRVAREVGVDDEEWVERILRSSGMLGRRGDALTMITGMGWAVRVSAADMRRVYEGLLEDGQASDQDGRIEPDAVAAMLERELRTARV